MTPSKARAPSNTDELSQNAWVRGPMMPILPSCQSPSRKVQVFDHSDLPFAAMGVLLDARVGRGFTAFCAAFAHEIR